MREGIKTNRNLFVTVKLNPKFNFIRPHVDSLLDKMYQEKRKDAESKIPRIEQDIQKIKFWFESKYASTEDVSIYTTISAKLLKAKTELQTQSYFGYDESLAICSEIDTLLYKIRESKGTYINRLKYQLNTNASEIKKHEEKKIDNYKGFFTSLVIFSIALVITKFIFGLLNSNNDGAVFMGAVLLLFLWGALGAGLLVGLFGIFSFNEGNPNAAIKKLKKEKNDLEKMLAKLEKIS